MRWRGAAGVSLVRGARGVERASTGFGIALAVGALCAASPVQRELARVRTAQLPATFSAGSAAVADLDGDGADDLIVSAALRSDASRRSLFLFRTEGVELGPFAAGREVELALDVTAWAAGDVHPDPGDELVLFTARGAFLARPDAAEEERFARLVEADFLWQLPDDAAAFLFQSALVDLDGDGRTDLFLPEPGGYAAAFRAEAGFSPAVHLRVPFEAAAVGAYLSAEDGRAGWRGERTEVQLGLAHSVGAGVDDELRLPSTLLTVVESVSAPQLVDWDADGDLDLLAQTQTGLHVFVQADRGFRPPLSQRLPVEADRDRRLDASYSSHAIDLNADRRVDCVVFAGDSKKSEVRTQALVYVQGAGRGDSAQTPEAPLFGPRGRPQDLLVFAGFVVRPDFVDVDGDGVLDLVISGVRPDLIDQLRSISSESIEADLFVYRGTGRGFSRQPDLAHTLNVPLERFEPTARFVGDLTGDGTSELLLRDDPERLRVLMVRPPRGGKGPFEVIERPLFELRIHERASIELASGPVARLSDLLVLERSQVQHVRFR